MTQRWECRCPTERETLALGERIGTRLERGMLLSLSGPLGAGKTVLVRGIAVGAGADPRAVRSPTFVLHQIYPGRHVRLHHLDLYRLGAGADIRFLDVDGLLQDGAVAIEWGELGDLRGYAALPIEVDVEADGARTVVLTATSEARVADAWADCP